MKKYFTVDDHIKAFERNKQIGLQLVEQCGNQDFNKKPDSDTWSLGEILDHLNFVDGLYIDRLKQTFADEESLPTGGESFKHRLWVRLTCKLFEPPYKIKFKVPGDNEPASDLSRETTLKQYEEHINTLIHYAEKGRAHDLEAIRIASPLSEKIKLSISEAFSFLATHQRRHLWQAEKMLANMGIRVGTDVD